ncbi:hypothetical protein [Blastococcus saxobsidens]|uniref:Uncharacterized protein n=1 Tax=Blastococcus saxobsidens (strain DD2) TaxID=1146883 RepID=H6RSE0_BLASD|nr:hypothetical protein [Blastococcus saxobsidens]CCG05532.1 conserved protein of unknown function [Blastococcus saxobsidens DD2]
MAHPSALVRAATLQLAAGLAGQVVALRRRRSYDIPFMTGSPDHVGRDSWWFGTAISAPSYMLGTQVWAIARLLRGPDDRARWALRVLGTGMTAGYLSERPCRRRVTPAGFDPVETPVVVAGWAGSVAMALLGRPQPRP